MRAFALFEEESEAVWWLKRCAMSFHMSRLYLAKLGVLLYYYYDYYNQT